MPLFGESKKATPQFWISCYIGFALNKSIPLLASLLLFSSVGFAQTTWYVDQGGAGDFTAIQDAIADANVLNGDVVVVRDGLYFENIDFFGKNLHLKSEHGPSAVTIDGFQSGSVVTFQSGEGSDAILEGFRVTNGLNWDGGGISIMADANGNTASPTIRNCNIELNIGNGGGGGMHFRDGSQSLIENCLIQNNSTTHYHGAGVVIFASAPVFKNCTIRNNIATGNGGGIAVWDGSDLYVNSCVFDGNQPDNIKKIAGSPQLLAEYSLALGDSNKGWFGTGCVDAAPIFATGPSGDACLSQIASGQGVDSPGLNEGDPSFYMHGTTRTDEMPDMGISDMGYHYPLSGLYVSNLVAGQTAQVVVADATPSNTVYFVWSFVGGGPVNTPFGTGYVSPPFKVVPLSTDSNGNVGLFQSVPPHVAGVNIWFHGADLGSQSMLNPLAMTIQ